MIVEAVDYGEKTIYHSPQTPGYTAWCTLWRGADTHLHLAFQQVTGSQEQAHLRRNVTVILESQNNGEDWSVAREVPMRASTQLLEDGVYYAAPADSSFCGHGLVSLSDGTLVTGLWGSGINESGYVQYSHDHGDTWSEPIFLMDARRYKTYPTVIRQLRDGRLLLFAGVWDRECGEGKQTVVKTMFVSDDNGKSWGEPIVVMTAEQGLCEESDFCELPNGDLFWVHRVEHFPNAPVEVPSLAASMGPDSNGYSDRMQSTLRKQGDGWKVEAATPAPFPHSGFPEVLLTQEGVILHVATEAIWWTADNGAHWERLSIPGSSYYPRAMQLPDGRILVIGHDGSDDPYGTIDQSIRQQNFRLKITPRKFE